MFHDVDGRGGCTQCDAKLGGRFIDNDPRGPERDIIGLAQENGGPVFATLSCGHVAELVNHFHYRAGGRHRCVRCCPDEVPHG
jgi:hypothetical protein